MPVVTTFDDCLLVAKLDSPGKDHLFVSKLNSSEYRLQA